MTTDYRRSGKDCKTVAGCRLQGCSRFVAGPLSLLGHRFYYVVGCVTQVTQ